MEVGTLYHPLPTTSIARYTLIRHHSVPISANLELACDVTLFLAEAHANEAYDGDEVTGKIAEDEVVDERVQLHSPYERHDQHELDKWTGNTAHG